VLAVATAKLKAHGEEKKGLSSKALADANWNLAKMSVLIPMENGKEKQLERKKKRHSADGDMAAIYGSSLSPSKHRKMYYYQRLPTGSGPLAEYKVLDLES
jgi:hypothetical protein